MPKLDTILAGFQVFVALGIAIFTSIPMAYFSSAMTPEEAISAGYDPMPNNWEAGVYNHGSYTRWYKAEKHPFWYFISMLGVVSSLGYVVYAGKKYKKAKSEDDAWWFDYNKKKS